ncbi:MAG: hypothetical protein CR975_04675 [Gammaproteobacteria bacterium]|nr:MAG: hypothetical protein CR975_04675 [Gammaproteobacteria bacterium]
MKHFIPPEVDLFIDARGLNCPLPILKARKALMEMNTGQILKITTSDPVSAEDFPVFAEATGNHIISMTDADGILTYYLQVGNLTKSP